MTNLGDLWHLRAAGKANSLGWSSFTIGGEVHPVGPGVVWSIPFEWAGVEGQDAALAAVRAYMLSKGDGNFGAHVNYGWMLNLMMLENMPGAVDFINTAAPWIVEQMALSAATKNYIYLDTDWLVTDGFECYNDVVFEVVRIDESMTAADIEALQLGPNKIGIPARLLLKFTAHKTAPKVNGFRSIEAWPAELVLSSWVPDALKSLATHSATKLSVDKPPPCVEQRLVGGAEFEAGDFLVTEATPYFVRAYSYADSSGETKYLRLRETCLADDGGIKYGYQMFDEAALRGIATDPDTVALLSMPAAQRQRLGYKFLLPALDGLFPVEVPQSSLIDAVLTVAPQLSMGARWARGAHGFCAFDFVVGVGGALLPCKPLPRAVAGDMERRLFVTAIRCARAPTRDTHATCDAHAPHHALRAAPRLTRPPDRRARAGTSKRSRSARGRT